MEALIPKLFIITAEASIVLFLLLLVMIIFNSKAKRKDITAANQLVKNYVNGKEERIATLKKHLQNIAFTGNTVEQAELLYNQEKILIKEFVTLYLHRDTYRLLDYPENVIDVDDHFLKRSGSATDALADIPAASAETASEENANAIIMAREQAESNEAQLKELSELRLKNTELNEHLFEALETITALMTEHGKKTDQEVESNAQKILEAIIHLRDQRLGKEADPSSLAPSPNDAHEENKDPWSVDLADNDGTLDDSTAVNLGISDELNTDLDTLDEDDEAVEKPQILDNAETATINLEEAADEADPWADALTEQASAEDQTEHSEPEAAAEETDPWADALAEQASAETASNDDEDDPWADALAEQEKSDKK